MITYDYYRIFYYVAQYKSFTKAARALHNNQPNITRCMNNLEQELKCTLFLRSNKGIALTTWSGFHRCQRKCSASDPSGKAGAVPRAISPCSPAPLQPFHSTGCTGTEELCGRFRYCHHSDLHPQAFTEKKSPALPGDPCVWKQI